METDSRHPGVFHRWIRATPEFSTALAAALAGAAIARGDRSTGAVVTDHRSSWVRRHRIGPLDVFAKTYDYPSLPDRLRGALRTTFLAAGRARREAAALDWLGGAGFAAPRVHGLAEVRRRGWLWRSVLFTAAWPGERLDHLLPTLSTAARRQLVAATWRFVDTLHAAGFVDGNLDLRNLLARTHDGDFLIAKIDSPKHRIHGPGRAPLRAVAADRARLRAQLRDFDS